MGIRVTEEVPETVPSSAEGAKDAVPIVTQLETHSMLFEVIRPDNSMVRLFDVVFNIIIFLVKLFYKLVANQFLLLEFVMMSKLLDQSHHLLRYSLLLLNHLES